MSPATVDTGRMSPGRLREAELEQVEIEMHEANEDYARGRRRGDDAAVAAARRELRRLGREWSKLRWVR